MIIEFIAFMINAKNKKGIILTAVSTWRLIGTKDLRNTFKRHELHYKNVIENLPKTACIWYQHYCDGDQIRLQYDQNMTISHGTNQMSNEIHINKIRKKLIINKIVQGKWDNIIML